MRRTFRVISLLLAFVMTLLAFGGCKEKKETTQNAVEISFSEEYSPAPINASYKNKVVFMYNPDRGFRVHNVIRVKDIVDYIGDEETLEKRVKQIFDGYTGRVTEPWSITYAYIYLTPWHLEELPNEALVAVEGIFKYARKNKIKLMASFCYNDNYVLYYGQSEEAKQQLASECADEATILRHIDQLAPIIAEYKDCCFTIKNGFIGYVGEWAEPYQYPPVDYNVITKAIVDKLCAPNELYFSHRLPRYTVAVKEAYPGWENAKWIGFNNCAFFGEQKNEGWASEEFQVGDSAGWWEYICEKGAYFPVTGEMYTSGYLNQNGVFLDAKESILELAHHHHTVFSFYHGKYDAKEGYVRVMDLWAREDIGPQWLDANGIIYDPNWFLDDNGNSVIRNCYEFIRDHLGYKLVAEKIKIEAADGKIKVGMEFKNYGFSAAFNLKSGFALLNDKYEVVSEVEVGEPTKWYSHDPETPKSTEVLNYSLSAELDAPTSSGKYYVAFYLRNLQGVGAQLSNEVQFEENYNILYTFDA